MGKNEDTARPESSGPKKMDVIGRKSRADGRDG